VDNGIIPSEFRYNPHDISSKECIDIVCVGAYDRKQKGYDILIDALLKVNKSFNLYICSHNSYNLNKISDNNVEIINVKPLSNYELRAFISSKDIFIASSRYEPFHMSLLEAMNTGIPFIYSDRVGIGERLGSKFDSMEYRYFNSQALANRVEYLISSPSSFLQKLYDNSIEFSSNYSWEFVFNKYLNFYRQLGK
jgi:glycosyltransferase involved in cell wall biosynthesis